MNEYSLTFINNSENAATFCLFQQDKNLASVSNVFPLAWFTKFVNPNVKVTFTWEIDYNYVWSNTGNLSHGVVFESSETLPVGDISGGPSITLSRNQALYFKDQTEVGATPNAITIYEDHTVNLFEGSVGIGMSGAGTFAVDAQPNQTLTFTPHPEYWCAFGSFKQGQVMDVQVLSRIQEVKYPQGCYSRTVEIGGSNMWSVS